MSPAPLQLNRSFVGSVHLEPSQEKPTTKTVTVTVTPTIARHQTSEREWMATLRVVFKGAEGKAAPYSGEIEAQGFFTVAAEYPADKLNKLIAVTCPTMLYSTIRELIATISGRSRHGVFLLPTVSFTDHDLKFEKPDELLKASEPQKATQ